MWSPTREYKERNLFIKPDKMVHFVEVLEYSAAYKKYRLQKMTYNITKYSMRYLSPLVLALYLQNSFSTWNRLKNNSDLEYEKAKNIEKSYNTSSDPNEITRFRNEYDLQRNSYKESIKKHNNSVNKRIIISSAILVTAGILEYFSFKLIKPTYKDEVLLENLSLQQSNNQVIPSFSLSYHF